MSKTASALQEINSTLDLLESKITRISESRMKTAGMKKTAGEVRFIKDKGTDGWAWDVSRHSTDRNIPRGHEFNPKKLKILLRLLRSTAMALGHAMSAYTQLAKARSVDISPDGMIGGVGYVKKISGIRQEYNNIIEALSSLTDSYHDEISAPHWRKAIEGTDKETKQEVSDLIEDVEQIRYSPEGFARQQELEQDQEARKKQEDKAAKPK